MTSRLPAGAALAVVAAAACVRGSLPPLELYRLDVAAAAGERQPGRHPPSFGGSVVVQPYTTAGVYGDPQIVYRIGETEYGAYPSREWAIPLSSMLAWVTADVLRNEPFAADVRVGAPAPAGPAIEWRGTVREFEEVIRGRQVFAVVNLDASLVRVPGDSVVWRGAARLERPVENPTMERIVTTLSALADAAVAQLASRAMPALGGSMTAAKRAPP